MSYSLIPSADYKAVCNAIRAKNGKTNMIKSGDMAAEISSMPTGGSASFNIHFGTEAPSDTSKLWVETDTYPTEIRVTRDIRSECSMVTGVLSLPTRLEWTAAGVVGTKIYTFGGSIPDGVSSAINVFDTETNTITTLSTKLPIKALGIAAGVVGTKIYLFGGNTGSYSLTTINVFDTETNTITTLSTRLPTSASGIAAGVVGTEIYLFGGSDGNYLSTINVFNTVTNIITTLSTALPTGTSRMATGVVGTKIYILGGYGSGGFSSTINLFTVHSYLSVNTVALIPSLTENIFMLMNVVELGVSAVYIGNADGKAEQVNAYLHNGTEWTLI